MSMRNRLRRFREAKGLSQRELAQRIHVTRGYITLLEGGQRQSPSLPVLRRLARALDVPVSSLL